MIPNLEREEGWKTYQSKSCVYNNRNKDNMSKNPDSSKENRYILL